MSTRAREAYNDPKLDNIDTDESRTFKKPHQTVGRPEVTDHDIHEDVIRDPPRNVPPGAQPGGTDPEMKAPKNDEFYADQIPEGAMGEDILGRKKKLDVQSDLIDTSETTFKP